MSSSAILSSECSPPCIGGPHPSYLLYTPHTLPSDLLLLTPPKSGQKATKGSHHGTPSLCSSCSLFLTASYPGKEAVQQLLKSASCPRFPVSFSYSLALHGKLHRIVIIGPLIFLFSPASPSGLNPEGQRCMKPPLIASTNRFSTP